MIQLSDQPDLPLEQGELGLAVDDSLLAPVEASDLPPAGENDCHVCGAFVGPDQDWCLECGAAVDEPRRIPGLATVGLAGVFTLVLAGGAVAAGVAALNDTIPPRDTKVETVAQEAPEEPALDDSLSEDPLASDGGSADDQLSPAVPADGTDGGLDPYVPYDGGGDGGGGGDDGGGGSTKPKPITLPAGAADYWDPLERQSGSNDPALAIDGKKTPSWFVSTPPDGKDMDVGLQVDLGEPRTVKRLTLTTFTPGYTVEVYGTKSEDAPNDPPPNDELTLVGKADSVDAAGRGSVKPVAGDIPGDEKFELTLKSSTKYRKIVLWFTKPPPEGPTVRISQLKFYAR